MAAELRTWALQHGMDESETGRSWIVAGDVVAVIAAAEAAYRPAWWHWERAAWALVDGDARRLAEALAGVRPSP